MAPQDTSGKRPTVMIPHSNTPWMILIDGIIMEGSISISIYIDIDKYIYIQTVQGLFSILAYTYMSLNYICYVPVKKKFQ
jgi:hypothetical protein